MTSSKYTTRHPGRTAGTRRQRRHRTVASLLILMLAACAGDPQGEPIRFTVPAGSGLSSVTDTLAARGIIELPLGFKLYARAQGASASLKPGVYELQRGTGWSEILETLTSGDVLTFAVTIPEAWTTEEIAARLAANTGASADSLLRILTDTASASDFDVPGPTLEGYLYPATYTFPVGTPPRQIVERMVERYKQVWTPERRERADSLGLSEREVVTLASIVEAEAKQWEERDTIAAVYLNRLEIGMRLQADPTVQYALDERQTRLLYAHIDEVADHPYNTYTQAGLPPGPIGSPSEGAIEAVLNPADVDFLYFVARPNGSHVFTRTLAEHNRAKRLVQRAREAGGEG